MGRLPGRPGDVVNIPPNVTCTVAVTAPFSTWPSRSLGRVPKTSGVEPVDAGGLSGSGGTGPAGQIISRRSFMEQKITAGRDETRGLRPLNFAQLNDDVLFGEVWAREEARRVHRHGPTAGGILDSSRKFHIAMMASPPERWRKYSPTPPFTRDGPRPGRPAYGEGGLRGLTAGGPGISLGPTRHGHEMTRTGPGPPTCAITSCA